MLVRVTQKVIAFRVYPVKGIPLDYSQLFLKGVVMILPQVHLRKPCYDFTFL